MIPPLNRLSIRLKRKIEYSGKFCVPFLRIDERWVLTESFESKQLELNDLESYTWEGIKEEDLAIFLNKIKCFRSDDGIY
ncbi:hypothetical protein [Olivibacter sp. CPCC 100613]|uniref:hypothetical protein n=1 Tax=Olivibacter sp. CPCC 100613 TaxID=3079931 RepID=UPI002FF9E69C